MMLGRLSRLIFLRYVLSPLVSGFTAPVGMKSPQMILRNARPLAMAKETFWATLNQRVNQGATDLSDFLGETLSDSWTTLRVWGASAWTALSTEHVLNLTAVSLAFAVLIIYHLRLNSKEKNGEKTWRSTQAKTREDWSKYVRESEQWLYSIQTLRNAITANTFLATTVLTLFTVIAGKVVPTLKNSWEMLPPFGMVAISMTLSAYEFLQSARLMTHAGFMFPVTKDSTRADLIMRKSQNGQWMGLRWLYISVTGLAWMLGGEGSFLASSLLITGFFRKIDKEPAVLDENTVHIMI